MTSVMLEKRDLPTMRYGFRVSSNVRYGFGSWIRASDLGYEKLSRPQPRLGRHPLPDLLTNYHILDLEFQKGLLLGQDQINAFHVRDLDIRKLSAQIDSWIYHINKNLSYKKCILLMILWSLKLRKILRMQMVSLMRTNIFMYSALFFLPMLKRKKISVVTIFL